MLRAAPRDRRGKARLEHDRRRSQRRGHADDDAAAVGTEIVQFVQSVAAGAGTRQDTARGQSAPVSPRRVTIQERSPRRYAAALVAGVLVGPVDIGIVDIAKSALARVPFLDVTSPLSPTQEAIVWELRIPRVALGALVGATLALAGATYQGVFRNPLADPYLLGVAAGAGLGATLAIAYGPGSGQRYVLPLAAFAGAVLAVGPRT